ncbi:MAG: hypothetical protein ACI90V_005967 [Bacillariaceae sp.]
MVHFLKETIERMCKRNVGSRQSIGINLYKLTTFEATVYNIRKEEAFETTMNKNKVDDDNNSFSMMDKNIFIENRVKDRKQFFEQHVSIQQKQSEIKSILPSTSSTRSTSRTSRTVGLSAVEEDSSGFLFFEEDRTDSDSIFDGTSERMSMEGSEMMEEEHETFKSLLSGTADSVESDTDPAKLLHLEESLYYSSKNYKENNELNNTSTTERSRVEKITMSATPPPHHHHPLRYHKGLTPARRNFKERTERSDQKIIPHLSVKYDHHKEGEREGFLKIITDVKYDNPEEKQMEGSMMWTPLKKLVGAQFNLHPSFDDMSSLGESERKHKLNILPDLREKGENTVQEKEGHSGSVRSSQRSQYDNNEDGSVSRRSRNYNKNVKIQVTRTIRDNRSSDSSQTAERTATATKSAESKGIADNGICDESSKISQSHSISVTQSHSIDGEEFVLSKDNSRDCSRDDSNSRPDSLFSLNDISVNGYNGINERIDVPLSTDVFISNNSICPFDSTDCSIDSKGNRKAKQQSASSEKKSKKSSNKFKLGIGTMAKMIKKAKRGVGSSVKKIKVLGFEKEKVNSTLGEGSDVRNGIPNENQNDFFDEKLAEKIMNDHMDETNFRKAIIYLDTGKELLYHATNMGNNKPERCKELTRMAHTYVYVSRQLAKTSLLACKSATSKNVAFAVDNDNITSGGRVSVDEDWNEALRDLICFPFEEFSFPSFLQCYYGGSTIDETQFQVEEALEILTTISEEEIVAIESILPSNETSMEAESDIQHNKAKVQVAINNAPIGTADDSMDVDIDIRRFVSNLQSFYGTDTTLNLYGTFSDDDWTERQANIQNRDDDQDGQLMNKKGNGDDVTDEDEARDEKEVEAESWSQSDMSFEELAYDYTKSLKFGNGRSYRKEKLESLAEDICPSTMIVSIPVKTKDFKKTKKKSFRSKK